MSLKIQRFSPSSYVSSYDNFLNDSSIASPIVTDGLQLHLDAANTNSYAPPSNRSIRYIRVYANGSTSNSSTHFVEIQALTSSGVNRALNIGSIGGISQYTGGSPEFVVNNTNWQVLTNGNTDSGDYIGFASGGGGVQLDLGQIYTDITQIKFWNYYADGRTYNSVTVFVSSDASNWTTIYGPQNTATTASGVTASNQISSTSWNDLSGNGRNGTIINPPSEVFTATNGGEINFSGTSYVSLGNHFGYGTGPFTLEAWVLCTSMVTNNIIWASQSSNVAGFYTIIFNSSSGWITGFFDGTNRPGTTLRPAPQINTWYHMVGIRNGTTVINYLNGFISYSNASSSVSVTSSDVRIGQNPATNGERWNGKIAIIRIYNRALSTSEVLSNFNNARGRFGV